jgi:RNA polymerase primary sigma factor
MAKNFDMKTNKNNFVVRTDAINQFLRQINKYKVLSSAEERELFKRIKDGDENAREEIIKHNQRFVFAVAKTYANDERVLDLVNEGNIGLMQAIDSYDYTKENRFLSYAVWYIRRSINAYIVNDEMFIQKTNNTKTIYQVGKLRTKFFSMYGRYPIEEELIELLKEKGVKISDISDLYELKINSISTTYDDEDGNAFENSPMFTSKTYTTNEYETDIEKEYDSAMSGMLMSVLDERERTIIEYAFGIGYAKSYTNNEIGEIMGMSAERIRQLKNGALKKMRMVAVERRI